MIKNENKPCEVCANIEMISLFQKESCFWQQCSKCGLIRIYPQPSQKQIDDIYNGGYYERWGKDASTDKTFTKMKKATFAKILSFLPPNKNSSARLLDIGAATGIFMEIAKESGYDVYGIEAARDGADEIKKKFGADKIFNTYFDENFNKCPPQFFDIISMIDSFEHFTNPSISLKSAYDLLKDGGYLIMSTPDTKSLSHFVTGSNWSHFSTEHLFLYSKSNLSKILQNYGFSVVRVNSLSKYFNAKYLSSMLKIKKTLFNNVLSFCLDIVSKFFNSSVPLKTGQMIAIARKNKANDKRG